MDFAVLWYVFSYIVSIHWSIISVFTLFGVVGTVSYKAKRGRQKYRDVEFEIVSKASKEVEGVLFNCISHHARKFSEYKINVIVDENSELNGRLKEYIRQFKNVELTIVPESFKTKAIAKGRAIHHHASGNIKPNTYYVFIDDDNLIMDDKFLYEIDHYSKLGYVAANGILYPRLSESKVTFVADFLRYADDLTIFRFLTGMMQQPLNGFHGELMIIKGEILKKIGFDRKTVTEDFAFARELNKYEHKVWQSATITSILSPHSIKDFIRQRNRWHRGISEDVKSASIKMKIVAGLRVMDMHIGIFGSWAVFPLWFFMPLPAWWIAFNLIGSLYYYASYTYGAFKMRDKVRYWFLYILLTPLYSIMETIVPYYKPKNNGFNVIYKNDRNAQNVFV